MSVTIRLARIGRKNLPAFKIVVANTRSKRNGPVLDVLGSYNPSENPQVFKYDKKKVEEWQSKGALMTDAVKQLIAGSYTFVPYPSAKKLKAQQAKEAASATSKEEA